MSRALDPEIAAALDAFPSDPDAVPLAPGDVPALVAAADALLAIFAQGEPPAPDVARDDHVVSVNGAELTLRRYRHRDAVDGAAVLYLHGGGMIAGSLELYDTLVAGYAQQSLATFFAVDYRRAPRNPGSGPATDAAEAFRALHDRAAEWRLDPARIAVMGDSGGGTLAASVAISARDAGLPLARQILLSPMLDDRTDAAEADVEPFTTWTASDNVTAWGAVLGEARGVPSVPPLIAPARLTDPRGLAPAYLDVGDLDLFRAEGLAYAALLATAGVPVELHVHAGAPHAFERFAPRAAVSARARADRIRVLRSL